MNYELTNFAVGFGVILWLWFGPLASLRCDNFRSDIRRLRDELFDFMWENEYDFNTTSYLQARQLLNGLLRLSNWITPITFLIAAYYHWDSTREFAIDETDPKLRGELERIRQAASKRLILFIFREGSWGIVFRMGHTLLTCARLASRTEFFVRRQIQQILIDAYKFGSPAITSSQQQLIHDRHVLQV